METQANLTQTFIDLEKQFWEAMRAKDVDAAKKLTSFPCIITNGHGIMSVDEAAFEKMMNSPSYQLESFSIGDAKVRVVNDDLAIIAYKVHENVSVDGKKQALDVADSSTWVREGGEWKCVQHTEAMLSAPNPSASKDENARH